LYLNNIYEDLSHYDAVVVNDKEQHRRYLLNREDVFTYLSRNKEEATHE
ncbi:MAG: ABC transporter ATP-binding protein, partial [Staphylococcus epidermidis]|nr:ABC transporter ATP-binding protein [Staphylococcus epidermidis]